MDKRGHEGDWMTVSLPINAIFDYKIRREDGNIKYNGLPNGLLNYVGGRMVYK